MFAEVLDREARQAVHDDVEPWPGHDSAASRSPRYPAEEDDDEAWTVVSGHVMAGAAYEATHGSVSEDDSAEAFEVDEERPCGYDSAASCQRIAQRARDAVRKNIEKGAADTAYPVGGG